MNGELRESGGDRYGISLASLTSWVSHPGIGLFLASFLSLFLELLLIRWVPSHLRIVAYYSNLMLLSAFLGLGCGTLLARREIGLHRGFAAFLLLLILYVSAITGFSFHGGADELRFSSFGASPAPVALRIVLVFALNVLVFLPLGELIGMYFRRMRPLQAYAWDLGGAIVGTLLFGIFSYFWFSPILGCALIMGLYLLYCAGKRHLLITCALFIAGLLVMVFGTESRGIWSPYNHISVRRVGADGNLDLVSSPADRITTMKDPPFYAVLINHTTYMWAGTLDGRRYTEPNRLELSLVGLKMPLVELAELYTLPHLIRPAAKDLLVVGSGGGMDVEAALLFGAERVDAVEIDPAIIQMGRQYNASQPYSDPRVLVHNTDARAFFKETDRSYDMVVFGLLDSHSLFSQMSNIRLDSYVHTQESLREAFGLLKEGGLLSIAFFGVGKVWLLDRLVAMVRSATGAAPLIYVTPQGHVAVFAGKGFTPKGPMRLVEYRRIGWVYSGTPEATDDWPYFYLRRRFIPLDYLFNIGILLAISVLFAFLSSEGKQKGVDLHFFFLGAGFLLLETKSITTISLYFGTTWFVSMVVILGVLGMVFLANLVASRLTRSTLTLYLPLIASVGFLYFFSLQAVSGWSFPSRLIFSLTVIPLPIFFAGLIFSSTFRESKDPSFSFGSNLLGAMVGGFAEYLGMITGMKALLLLVMLFYLASLLVRLRLGHLFSKKI